MYAEITLQQKLDVFVELLQLLYIGKMMKKLMMKRLAAVFMSASLLLGANMSNAAEILVVNEGGRLGPWSDLFANTFGDNLTVTNSWNTLPSDLSSFDIIWDGGFLSNPGEAVAQSVIDFVNNGGGFYGQTERPCCETHNGWVESIFKALTGDMAMQFGGFGDSPVAATGTFLTPDTTILLEPNDIRNTTFDISAPGQLFVSDTSKVFAAQDVAGGFNIGVAYATEDLVNNAGRIVTISDIDWLSSISDDEARALENIRAFLLDGESLVEGCGENPNLPQCVRPVSAPATSALMLIGLALMGVRISRKR